MERTESIVVSVGPSYENAKIQEMGMFGWNLQGRQEVVGHLREAETPDNLLHAIGRGAMEGATNTKTVEYDHYVKLHFVRSLSMPNLERIKRLEAEYFNLPYPTAKGIVWPVLFTLMPLPSLSTLFEPSGRGGSAGGPMLLPVIIGWVIVGVLWVKKRVRQRTESRNACAASRARIPLILNEVAQLLANAEERPAAAARS